MPPPNISLNSPGEPHSPFEVSYSQAAARFLPSQLLIGSPFLASIPPTPGSVLSPFHSSSHPLAMAMASAYPPSPYRPSYVLARERAGPRTRERERGQAQEQEHGHGRILYFGNLPSQITPSDVINTIKSGPLESVKHVPEKKCCFVTFLNQNDAERCYEENSNSLEIKGSTIKVGWGKQRQPVQSLSPIASRAISISFVPINDNDGDESFIRTCLSRYGDIEFLNIQESNINGTSNSDPNETGDHKKIEFVTVHFFSIFDAIKLVKDIPHELGNNVQVKFTKDRCDQDSNSKSPSLKKSSFGPRNTTRRKISGLRTQRSSLSNEYQSPNPNEFDFGYPPPSGYNNNNLMSALSEQNYAAAAVATAAGGLSNLGNRTVYLGNLPSSTTTEEICNVVRGGLLQTIRYMPIKHICFLTFIDPSCAAQFFATGNLQGLILKGKKVKVGWGKHSGDVPNNIALAVTAGASRNVYIGLKEPDELPASTENEEEPEYIKLLKEDYLRSNFQHYGEIEQINFFKNKTVAFINFTNISNSIRVVEDYNNNFLKCPSNVKDVLQNYSKFFKINYGKDRCGNPPRSSKKKFKQQYDYNYEKERKGSEIEIEIDNEDFGDYSEDEVDDHKDNHEQINGDENEINNNASKLETNVSETKNENEEEEKRNAGGSNEQVKSGKMIGLGMGITSLISKSKAESSSQKSSTVIPTSTTTSNTSTSSSVSATPRIPHAPNLNKSYPSKFYSMNSDTSSPFASTSSLSYHQSHNHGHDYHPPFPNSKKHSSYSTSGSQVMAQYLAQTQHDNLLYAAAVFNGGEGPMNYQPYNMGDSLNNSEYEYDADQNDYDNGYERSYDGREEYSRPKAKQKRPVDLDLEDDEAQVYRDEYGYDYPVQQVAYYSNPALQYPQVQYSQYQLQQLSPQLPQISQLQLQQVQYPRLSQVPQMPLFQLQQVPLQRLYNKQKERVRQASVNSTTGVKNQTGSGSGKKKDKINLDKGLGSKQ